MQTNEFKLGLAACCNAQGLDSLFVVNRVEETKEHLVRLYGRALLVDNGEGNLQRFGILDLDEIIGSIGERNPIKQFTEPRDNNA